MNKAKVLIVAQLCHSVCMEMQTLCFSNINIYASPLWKSTIMYWI